jgi:protoporphyrinogen oxidase
MMNELERERQLLKAGAIHDKITAEAKIREIDEQLSRLLDLFVEGAISADEYKEKKASLINKKIAFGNNSQAIFSPVDKKTHHIENPVSGSTDGKWLEPMRDFLTLAHQASYVASAGTAEELADFFKKICSNRKVANATLYVSYSSAFKILAETQNQDLGSRHQKVRTYFKGFPLK